MQIRAVALAMLFLASSLVQAEANPNQQSLVLELDEPIRAMAFAEDGKFIAAGMADPFARFSTASGASVDEDVWFWWNQLGSQQHAGNVDAGRCSQAGNTESCQTNVVDMALSADGRRLVVLGADPDGTTPVGTLVFWEILSGQVHKIDYGTRGLTTDTAREPRALDMSPDGKHVLVTVRVPTGVSTSETNVYKYTWDNDGSTPAEQWKLEGAAALPGDSRDAAISPDGRRASVAATTHHRIVDGEVRTSSGIGGTALAVDFSRAIGSDEYWSVAGFSGGEVALYRSTSDTGSMTPAFSQRPANNVAQHAVAISEDGNRFAAGSANGVVRVYANPFTTAATSALIGAEAGLNRPVYDLAFDASGRYLVVAAGNSVYFYGVAANDFVRYWHVDHVLTSNQDVTHVAITADGATVAVAAGAKIFQYAAEAGVKITKPSLPLRLSPGNSAAVEITVENTGNRLLAGTVTGGQPADQTGWVTQVDSASLAIHPERTKKVTLTITAPSDAAAGSFKLPVQIKEGAKTVGLAEIAIEVLQEQRWALERASTEVLAIDPGKFVEFAVQATNLGNALDSTAVVVELDEEGWSAEALPPSVELDPGASQNITIRVTAPADAQELQGARATVSLAVDPTAKTSFEAVVGAKFGVSAALATLEQPSVYVGNRTVLTLSVTNLGNAMDSIRIESVGTPAAWTIRFPDDKAPHTVFSLAPGASWDVFIDVQVPAGADVGNYQLAFRATSLGDSSQSSVAKTVLAVEEAPPPPKPSGNDSPGPGAVLLVAGLVAVAAWLRRR